MSKVAQINVAAREGKVESKPVNGVMARPIACLAVAQNGDGQGLERGIVKKLVRPL